MGSEEFITPEQIGAAEELYRQYDEKLEAYLELLMDWNKSINVVSRAVSRETIREHIVHSLVPGVMGLLNSVDVWVDAGTGGGLPGIPLSIVNADKKWILNDNIRKKMKVVSAIADEMELTNVEIQAKSISLAEFPTGSGIVTKHAFKIPDLLRLVKGKPWKEIVMWKGAESAREELARSGKEIDATVFVFNTEDSFYEGKAIVKLNRKKRSK